MITRLLKPQNLAGEPELVRRRLRIAHKVKCFAEGWHLLSLALAQIPRASLPEFRQALHQRLILGVDQLWIVDQ
jgi:hypothetical protein